MFVSSEEELKISAEITHESIRAAIKITITIVFLSICLDLE
jgi:hypothetical protein